MYLYIETLLSLISGYVFWVVVSRVVTPEVVGVAAAVISLSTIFATIATIGIPSGIQRFLGKGFAEQKMQDVKKYSGISLLWISIGIAACGIILLVIHNLINDIFRVNFDLILVAVLLVASSALTMLFRAIVISSLKTKVLPIIMAVSTAVKLGLAVALALLGYGALGVTLGFASFSVVASIILGFVLLHIFSKHKVKSDIGFEQSSRDILASSTASWIPAVIYTIGAHLGPVIVFGSQGAGEAGVYFMAFAIVIAISAVMQVLFTISYPALSGMRDGRKRFTWQIIKMSILIALPLSSAIIFYSNDIMLLFGSEYAGGGSSLSILLSSMLPIAISTGIITLAYAYGNYKQVLVIGIASNLPRVILYFALLPLYGSTGAAMSYTIGSIIGLAASLIIARSIGIRLSWKEIALIAVMPTGLVFALSYFDVNYLIGVSATLISSYLIFLRLRLLNKVDLQGILDILPYRTSKTIIAIIDFLNDNHISRKAK